MSLSLVRHPEGLPPGASVSAHHQDTVPGSGGGHDAATSTCTTCWPRPSAGPEHHGAAVLSAASREGNHQSYCSSKVLECYSSVQYCISAPDVLLQHWIFMVNFMINLSSTFHPCCRIHSRQKVSNRKSGSDQSTYSPTLFKNVYIFRLFCEQQEALNILPRAVVHTPGRITLIWH